MLGVEHQPIYCEVTQCSYREKHIVRDGKTNKIVEVYYTCEKETVYINKTGKCKEIS